MGTFGVKRASDEYFCPSTVYARLLYTLQVLEAHTRPELMMRYGLKMGSRFLLMKDEVTNVLSIRSAIWPFLLVDRS